MTPSWANYGPYAKPSSGQPGYVDGMVYYGFDPHSSPDGLDFYEPVNMDPEAILFPEEFHGRAFVARFGELGPPPPQPTARPGVRVSKPMMEKRLAEQRDMGVRVVDNLLERKG
jgi:hypothetical protein